MGAADCGDEVGELGLMEVVVGRVAGASCGCAGFDYCFLEEGLKGVVVEVVPNLETG